jgi:hypothetical protein
MDQCIFLDLMHQFEKSAITDAVNFETKPIIFNRLKIQERIQTYGISEILCIRNKSNI